MQIVKGRMRYFNSIIIILILVSCNSQHRETQVESVKELYKYHRADQKIRFLRKIDPTIQKKDTSEISVIDFQVDTINKEVTYFNSTLLKIDTIGYTYDGEIYIFEMFQFNLPNEYDEESIILMKNNNPYLIYNYPWGEYLFIVSDSIEKNLMKKVIENSRLIDKLFEKKSAPNNSE